jgi:PAS domain S-box-containing protein
VSVERALWLGGALLISAMVAFAAYDVEHRRDVVVEATHNEGADLARTLAQDTAHLLGSVDIVVRDAAADGLIAPMRELRWGMHQRLQDRAHAIPAIKDLFVVGADGRRIAGAADFPAQAVSIANQPYIMAQSLDVKADLYVSDAFRRYGDDKWTIAFSHGIRGPKGEFLGAAVAEIDLDYFRELYAAIGLGTGRVINLFGRGGQLLACYPGSDADIGRYFSEQPAVLQLPRRVERLTMVLHNPVDERNEIYAVEAVPGFPLVVGVGVDEAAALAAWRSQASHSAARTGLLCLAVVALIGLVIRQLRRRERAEKRLRVQTALLDELFESAPEAIVMLDLDNRVTRVNREFTHLFGFTAQEVRNRALDELIVPDDLKQQYRRMTQAVSQGRHVNKETERLHKDRRRLPVSMLGAPILTAAGQIASYAIYRDISERALAEAERAKLESRLRQAEKLEALGTMAGGIAHDFNNVLAAILGYADMALDAAFEVGVIKRYIGNVLTAAHRGRALVDQILTYSRSSRGKPIAVKVHSIVGETLELVQASLPSNIELRSHLAAGNATVIADPTHIHQLVMNLCKNAIDAMRNGGTLKVALDSEDTPADRELSHGLLSKGRYVHLCVEDDGSGMPAAVAERVFEPFFTTKEPGTGTGLGLALVHGIVTDLRGAIHVASAPGQGSTFRLYLPRSDAPATEQQAEKDSIARGHGECVLLVEDEEQVMLLTEEMLAALGYEPTGFIHAAEALSEFRADPGHFDAVIVDYLMPDMTGAELVTQLRRVRSDVPAVLVSGYIGSSASQEALLAGIGQILAKPLEYRQLAKAMAHVLARAPVG